LDVVFEVGSDQPCTLSLMHSNTNTSATTDQLALSLHSNTSATTDKSATTDFFAGLTAAGVPASRSLRWEQFPPRGLCHRGYNRCGYYRITFSFENNFPLVDFATAVTNASRSLLRTIFPSWTLPPRLLPHHVLFWEQFSFHGLCHCGYYHPWTLPLRLIPHHVLLFENNFGVGIQKEGSSFRTFDLQWSHNQLLKVISISYFN